MRIHACLALAISAGLQPCLAIVPSSIEKTVFNSPYELDPITSKTYFDGLGREIRTVSEEGSGDIISATRYDDAGRPIHALKPYYSTAHAHGWNGTGFTACITEADAYFNGTADRPDDGGYPYSETVYLKDPLKKSKETGAPGSAFRVGSGHTVKKWYLGVNGPNFVASPTEGALDVMASVANASHILEVTKDEDNRFTQVVKDYLGRVVKTVSDPNPASTSVGDEIVTYNVYDAAGRLIRTHLPGTGGTFDANRTVTYTYSSDGKLIAETYPDEGTTQYLHDAAGRLRLKSDARSVAEAGAMRHLTYYKYDQHGRKIEEGRLAFDAMYFSSIFSIDRLNSPNFPSDFDFTKSAVRRWYYDDIRKFDPFLNIPMEVDYSTDPNGRGKLVASVAYNNAEGYSTPVMKFFRYDKYGQLSQKTIVIPEIPVQTIKYWYNFQGRLMDKELSRQTPYGTVYSSTNYDYDAQGRMVLANVYPTQSIVYQYEPLGKLKRKVINGGLSEDRTYTIRDWLKSITVRDPPQATGTTRFLENIFYESITGYTPQYSGNISGVEYWDPVQTSTGLGYTYDGANRLTATGSSSSAQAEAYTYDSKGRIVTKRENNVTHGPYIYGSTDNRVSYIQNHPTRSNTGGNFFYDANGNMIYDRSKKMAVYYDTFNLPYRFRIYNTDPASGQYLTHSDIQSTIEILYDADGQRVMKRTIPH